MHKPVIKDGRVECIHPLRHEKREMLDKRIIFENRHSLEDKISLSLYQLLI